MGGKGSKRDRNEGPNSKFKPPQIFHHFGQTPFSIKFRPIPEEEMGQLRAAACCDSYELEREANSGPEDTHPGATGEDTDEDIIYTPPFLGRLKGGDKKITLPAYERTHSVGARVVPCALIYEQLKASHMLKPLEGTTFEFGYESSQKTCAYHPNKKGHTIEECVELKAAIRNLINVGENLYMWGGNIVLTCDQPEPSMPVTEHTLFYCHYFTPFKKALLYIYSLLVRKGILASIRKDDEAIDPVGIEIWNPCPYHDATYHNIARCLGFHYDVESLINMGKIQVEFTPPPPPHLMQQSEKEALIKAPSIF
ncbi:hypothetical protein KY290_025352 [Solanum tuberosum]|uniref:Uncharacterized protein n=1 Tax=Solanum tuberosum TaxID=4113 RepID=A0ABQ7UTC2_SOLTU|nr:hypothetical protein KY290_025352 [Solanum tuberosum]